MKVRCRWNGVAMYLGGKRYALTNQVLVLLMILSLFVPAGVLAGTVKIGVTLYDSFQGAYAAAQTGAVLKSQAMNYPEGLLLNRTIALTIQGGYDSIFGSATGFTTINGPLTVSTGSVIVGNLIIAGSNATVFVPNVVGQTLSTAQTTLVANGVIVGTVTTQYHASVPKDAVINQSPGAGAYVVSGSGVNLVVSLGAAPVAVIVPSLVGKTQALAENDITAAGLKVGVITSQNSVSVPSGSVISQNPQSGASVMSGTVVTLIVSTGPAGGGVTPPVISPLPAAETTPPVGSGLSTTAAAPYVVLAWNDLGMHCLNPSYDTAVILPPYNTVRAQVIQRGNKPVVVTSGLTVSYRIVNNTTSQKGLFTQFWTYALSLFGATPAIDHGLNLDDPTVSNGLTGTMLAKTDVASSTPYFIVSGIPVTPVNDSPGGWNPFQVIEVTVKSGGTTVAQTRATVPTSDEINCGKCHGNSSDPTVVFNDVLEKHDAKLGTNLLNSKPVRCSSCHGSPALNAPLLPGIKYLSEAIHGFHSTLTTQPNCYDCHPGAVTQCNRSTKHTAVGGNCITCHGTLATVASSITSGSRVPWANEPKCVTCHNTNVSGTAGVAQVDTGTTLYRNAVGHSGVFCSACHGSPHSMTPSNQASDNYQPLQYQGDARTIGDCRSCHDREKHPTSRGGGSASDFAGSEGHGAGRLSACSVCHTGFTNASNSANWPHQFQWKSR